MKILHVTPYFAPAWAYGGSARAVYEIAKRQVLAGHDVTVLTTDALDQSGRAKPESDVMDGIRIWRLRNLSNWLTWKFHFVTPYGNPRIQKEYDVIHLHEVRTLLNVFAIQSFRAKRYFISPWGTLPHNNSLVGVKKLLDVLLLPILRGKIEVSLAQTEHEVKILKKFKLGSNIHLVPLGIDYAYFKSLPSKRQARSFLQLSYKKPVILFLGRFSPAKGIEVVLRSFKKAQASDMNATLLLVGRDDGYLSEIKRIITKLDLNGNVQIEGPLYDADRLNAYRAADLFISLPTVYEETSTTCLEALACNTPVVTNRKAEIPFLDPEDGVVHVENNTAKVAKVIKELIVNQTRVNKLKVKENFDWNQIATHLLRLYE